jgi:hypothetical protein
MHSTMLLASILCAVRVQALCCQAKSLHHVLTCRVCIATRHAPSHQIHQQRQMASRCQQRRNRRLTPRTPLNQHPQNAAAHLPRCTIPAPRAFRQQLYAAPKQHVTLHLTNLQR